MTELKGVDSLSVQSRTTGAPLRERDVVDQEREVTDMIIPEYQYKGRSAKRSPLSWKMNDFDLIKPAEASPLVN